MPKRNFLSPANLQLFFYFFHLFQDDFRTAFLQSPFIFHQSLTLTVNNLPRMKNIQFLKMIIMRVFPITGLLIFLASFSGIAQTTKFTGKLLSDSGMAVEGASVRLKGSSVGTVTGADGSFCHQCCTRVRHWSSVPLALFLLRRKSAAIQSIQNGDGPERQITQ